MIRFLKAPEFESTNIQNLGYIPILGMFFVAFLGGGTYVYFHYSEDRWENVVETINSGESVGKFFHRNIKNKYKFEKLSDGEIAELWI